MPRNQIHYLSAMNLSVVARTESALDRTQKAAQAHLPSIICPALCVRAAEMCGWR